ncbi:MAG: hypothetical protein ACREBE_11950, partial [bacterium]
MKSPFVKLLLVMAVFTASCRDNAKRGASADSSLARDLELASAQTAQPTFQDTALAPATVKASPEPKKDAPSPLRPRRTRPKSESPRPAPQQQAPVVVQQTTIPAPTPAPIPAPAVEHGEIATGSAGVLTSGAKVCTASNMVGDKLVATLNSPLAGSRGTELPAGSTVVLEVASVRSGDNPDSAAITFRVRSIVVNDKTY